MIDFTAFVLLIAMLFCHLVDDYYLQGILASMKQRDWWKKNAPDKLYEHDYVIALMEHAFSWTCMIHVPIIVYLFLTQSNIPESNLRFMIIIFLNNWVIHMIVDHMKANLKRINLVTDQYIHILQVFATWCCYLVIFIL